MTLHHAASAGLGLGQSLSRSLRDLVLFPSIAAAALLVAFLQVPLDQPVGRAPLLRSLEQAALRPPVGLLGLGQCLVGGVHLVPQPRLSGLVGREQRRVGDHHRRVFPEPGFKFTHAAPGLLDELMGLRHRPPGRFFGGLAEPHQPIERGLLRRQSMVLPGLPAPAAKAPLLVVYLPGEAP